MHFSNLGDLIDRDRDPRKTAIIDLGGEGPARELSYGWLDSATNAVARMMPK